MSNKLVYKVSFTTDDPNQSDDRYFYSMKEAGEFIDQVMWKETVSRLNLLHAAGINDDETQSLRERTTATISIVTMNEVPYLA